jgi:hypothetical protein
LERVIFRMLAHPVSLTKKLLRRSMPKLPKAWL